MRAQLDRLADPPGVRWVFQLPGVAPTPGEHPAAAGAVSNSINYHDITSTTPVRAQLDRLVDLPGVRWVFQLPGVAPILEGILPQLVLCLIQLTTMI